MSLLYFHPDYSIVICTSCQYALQTTTLSGILSHLMRFHKGYSPAERQAMAADVPTALLAPPDQVKHFQPPPTLPPIPQLATFTDGIACKLCPADQIYICRQNIEKLKPCKKKQRDHNTVLAKDAMIAHLGAVHGWRRKQGA
ncbi:hypothetical protein B0J14DRAFT_690317 [Halenospora varia]|nr:hypothetical protein B0J14DRAFT_690317 [Halenospora varia]